jgi:hypothetical protein
MGGWLMVWVDLLGEPDIRTCGILEEDQALAEG